MSDLTPLFFEPILLEKIWGGSKLVSKLHKKGNPATHWGESWEISGITGNVSRVATGPFKGKSLLDLIQTYRADLLGHQVYKKYGEEFPLLIKFIDARDDLSIQVHPSDKVAREKHDSRGKTEMWYIMQADPGAHLIAGFNRNTDPQKFQDLLQKGKLEEILNYEEVKKGDIFFMPAGRVHSIGKGILLAEIQETSDITYRIYDFNRVDKNGNSRELHIEDSLQVIDYKKRDYKTNTTTSPAVSCEHFETNIITIDQYIERDYSTVDSFVILIGVEGESNLIWEGKPFSLQMGDTCLIPASIPSLRIETLTNAKLLECYIPNGKEPS